MPSVTALTSAPRTQVEPPERGTSALSTFRWRILIGIGGMTRQHKLDRTLGTMAGFFLVFDLLILTDRKFPTDIPLHHQISGPFAPFRTGPGDVSVGILYITGFAVQAIGRIQLELGS